MRLGPVRRRVLACVAAVVLAQGLALERAAREAETAMVIVEGDPRWAGRACLLGGPWPAPRSVGASGSYVVEPREGGVIVLAERASVRVRLLVSRWGRVAREGEAVVQPGTALVLRDGRFRVHRELVDAGVVTGCGTRTLLVHPSSA